MNAPSTSGSREEPSFREVQERFWLLRLVTEVRADGVYVRFDPIQRSFRRISFDAIRDAAADTYSAADYGGWHWGVRMGLTGNTAYRLRGREGVRLDLRNGERLFVGSQRSADLEAAIPETAGST